MLVYWIVLAVVRVFSRILFRVQVIGKDSLAAAHEGRPLVIAPNHLSMADPIFVATAVMDWRRMVTIAKQELFQNPLLGWFFHCLGAVAIERGRGDTDTLDKVTEACRAGRTLLIFPEGTRSKDGKLGVLKGGAFLIASQAGAGMLPCRLIYDTADGRAHLFCRVRVCFGPLIPPEAFAIPDPSRKVAALRGMKARLKGELEALWEQNHFA